MTREETKVILSTIATVYPPNLLPSITELTVNIWFQLLQDMEYKNATSAVATWISTNKYPPTIADIRSIVAHAMLAKGDGEMSGDEAWSLLINAIRHYGRYDKEGAIRHMGPSVWKIASRDWRYYCDILEEQVPNEKSRFLKTWAAEQKKEVERLQIPVSIQEAFKGIGKGVGQGIGEGNEARIGTGNE